MPGPRHRHEWRFRHSKEILKLMTGQKRKYSPREYQRHRAICEHITEVSVVNLSFFSTLLFWFHHKNDLKRKKIIACYFTNFEERPFIKIPKNSKNILHTGKQINVENVFALHILFKICTSFTPHRNIPVHNNSYLNIDLFRTTIRCMIHYKIAMIHVCLAPQELPFYNLCFGHSANSIFLPYCKYICAIINWKKYTKTIFYGILFAWTVMKKTSQFRIGPFFHWSMCLCLEMLENE